MSRFAQHSFDEAAWPSLDEAKHYYDGLPSKPLLVARTSIAPFPPVPPQLTPMERSERAFPYVTAWVPGAVQKHFGPIGHEADSQEQHKIVRVWCQRLRDELVAALEESPLADCWSTLYTVRITSTWRRTPDRVQPTSDVVLLVGVDVTTNQQSSVPRWQESLQAALACRAVLRAWEVDDVEVEIFTSCAMRLADNVSHSSDDASSTRGPEEDTTLDSLVDFEYETNPRLAQFASLRHEVAGDSIHAFLDYPGQRLEKTLSTGHSYRPSGAWGSLGFYVGLDGSPDTIYALTSRHVVDACLPPDRRITQDDQMIPVLYGTQESLASYTRSLRLQVSDTQSAIENQARRLMELQEMDGAGGGAAHAGAKDRFEKQMQKLEEDLAARTTFANDYLPRLINALDGLATHEDAIPSKRLLGHVAESPPHGRTRHGAWNDWALVRLSDERRAIVQGHLRANAVLIDSLPVYTESLRAIVSRPTLSLAPEGDFLLMKAPLPPSPANGIACRHPRWVVKRGAKTGLTYGLTVELEAVVRRPLSDGTMVVAYALLVLDHRGENDAFSRRGDSGSAVLDTEGHVVGLLDAGVGSGVGENEHERLLRLFHRPGDPGELPWTPSAQAIAVPESQPPSPFRPLSLELMAGEQATRRPDATLVTPMEWITDSIEEATGKKPVVL